jgi:hypothetical protein
MMSGLGAFRPAFTGLADVPEHPGESSTVPRWERQGATRGTFRDAANDRRATENRRQNATDSGRVLTARTVRGVIAPILRTAVTDRVIASSPLDGVKIPPRPDKVLVYLYTVERVLALRDSITPEYAAAIVVGAGAGVGTRSGECFGLTVDRVDFLRGVITIDRQVIAVVDGRTVFGPLKTPASVRKVCPVRNRCSRFSPRTSRDTRSAGTG